MEREETKPQMDPSNPLTAPTFDDACNLLRADIKRQEGTARALKAKAERDRRGHEDAFPGQTGEVLANLMLAVRHLEDARMRVGKAIQYAGDGVSVYDRESKPAER